MKQLFQSFTIAALLTFAVGAAASQEPSPVIVTALMTTAGPYGESWVFTMTPEGRASLKVFYLGNPGGSLMAQFDLGEAAIETIRKAVTNEHFFEIPAKLAPKVTAFHKPALQLDVRVGGAHHNVNVYDPEQLGKDAAVERFRKVWNAVFAALPLRPTW